MLVINWRLKLVAKFEAHFLVICFYSSRLEIKENNTLLLHNENDGMFTFTVVVVS